MPITKAGLPFAITCFRVCALILFESIGDYTLDESHYSLRAELIRIEMECSGWNGVIGAFL